MTKRDKTTGLPKPQSPKVTQADAAGGKSPKTLKEYRSRAEREAEVQRMIFIGTFGALGVVAIILAIAFVIDLVINPVRVVASVDGQSITVREFQEEVRIQRVVDNQRLLNEVQTYMDLGFFETSQEAVNVLYSNVPEIRELIDSFSANDQFGLRVLNTLIDNQIVRKEATARGVTVTDEQIDEQIRRLFRFETPEETDSEATPEPETTPTVTPTPFITPTPSPTPIPTEEMTPTPTATLEFTPAPTFTPVPTQTASERIDVFNNRLESFYQRMSRDAGVSRERVRQYFEMLALREALARNIFGEKQTTVWANTRHIIVPTLEQAQDIYDALLAGESFATLAAALGTDGTAQGGGELSWLNTEQGIDSTFGEKARTLPIGEISEPFQTDFGWHVMQVRDREEREAGAGEIDFLLQTEFTEWLRDYRNQANIETADFWTDFVPSDPPLRFE